MSTQAREPGLHYEHKEIGYNYRMSNILAGIGRSQLKSLDQYVEKRREIFEYYKKNLMHINHIKFMPEIKEGRSTNWLSVILIENANHKKIDNIIMNFNKKNIEVRPIWKPMHLQPIFKGIPFYHYSQNSLSEELFEHGLCLPSGSNLSKNDMDKIIGILIKESR